MSFIDTLNENYANRKASGGGDWFADLGQAVLNLPRTLVSAVTVAPIEEVSSVIPTVSQTVGGAIPAVLSPTFSALPTWGKNVGGAVGGALDESGLGDWIIPAALIGGAVILMR